MTLVVKNLSKKFDDTVILDNFNFKMEEGEIVALIGESGTGKTTFIRILNSLIPADQGYIAINDAKLMDTDEYGHVTYTSGSERAAYDNEIGMVFQDYQLFPNMSALENLMEAPLAQKELSKQAIREKAIALLEQMGLGDKINAMPKTLSGGQKQRVAIARSMMLDPKVLCFDEPTSALDKDSASVVGQMIQRIASEGTGIILVTHDVNFAEEYSTRVLSSEEFINLQKK